LRVYAPLGAPAAGRFSGHERVTERAHFPPLSLEDRVISAPSKMDFTA